MFLRLFAPLVAVRFIFYGYIINSFCRPSNRKMGKFNGNFQKAKKLVKKYASKN